MNTYRVNADFTVNVTTYLCEGDVRILDGETLEDAINREARSQILAGNYEVGDPVDGPNINWHEDADE